MNKLAPVFRAYNFIKCHVWFAVLERRLMQRPVEYTHVFYVIFLSIRGDCLFVIENCDTIC